MCFFANLQTFTNKTLVSSSRFLTSVSKKSEKRKIPTLHGNTALFPFLTQMSWGALLNARLFGGGTWTRRTTDLEVLLSPLLP